jgi:hypothetical protein
MHTGLLLHASPLACLARKLNSSCMPCIERVHLQERALLRSENIGDVNSDMCFCPRDPFQLITWRGWIA